MLELSLLVIPVLAAALVGRLLALATLVALGQWHVESELSRFVTFLRLPVPFLVIPVVPP